ncbi:MAG: S1C family serine protease [Spirochaetia bacterium]
MKYQVLLFMLFPLLLSCSFQIRERYEIPRHTEVLQEEIQSFIEEDKPEMVIETIQYLQSQDRSFPEMEVLYRDALELLERQYDNAVNENQYLTALSKYRSLRALGGDDIPEHGEGMFFMQFALEQLEDIESPVPGTMTGLIAMDFPGIEAEVLREYYDIVRENENIPVMRRIIEYAQEQYAEQIDFIPEMPEAGEVTTAELMNGAVTIWVNRGIRIENGLGFPDRVIGSGFFIDNQGHILTNYHVISSEVDPEFEGYSRLFIRLSENSQERIPARVIGYDRIFDLALLKVEIDPEFAFQFVGREDFEPGEQIFAIGSPGGLENTITSGIISATGRAFLQMGDAMQVDVPINPGSSGGPLLNSEGELAGIVFSGIEQFEGVNFAVPSHWIRDLMPELYAGDEVGHVWVGAALHDVREQQTVMYTVPGSPADRIGLSPGDRIISINGQEFDDVQEIHKMLLTYTGNTLINIEWQRDDQRMSGVLCLDERPFNPIEAAFELDSRVNLLVPLFGLEIERTTSNIIETNYIVSHVYQGSIADESGISENDPLRIMEWNYLEEEEAVTVQLFIKKRRLGFLESVIQIGSYLQKNNFI